MDILSFLTVYNSYIKYIYYLLAIIIIIVLIMMFKKLIILANSSSKLLETQERIDAKLVETQEKLTKVEYTATTSIPFFLKIFGTISLIKAITKDFFDTKKKKRSIHKSINKIRKLNKKANNILSLGKLVSSLVR
ncbi:MAG: hypothetical protein MSC52_06060 [Solobacterium sp.]|nr:hypothetical protein [Solobacterium sp.]MCI7157133.1 hypothetical protein [Solobacterium sp.]MDY4493524.1 hypothetical protein [Erysipelotrichaceae bacterium]MDY5402045.1 hypothetical protein [Erysipelotrichaceae bacterium]